MLKSQNNSHLFKLLGLGSALTWFVFASMVAEVPVLAAPITFDSFISVGTSPSRSILTPDGVELYVTNSGSNTVSVINTATNAVTTTLSVGSNPGSLAVSADGSRVYVANNGGVSIINTTTKAVTNVSTPGPVRDLALSPDESRVYLAMEFSGVGQLLTSTNAVSTVSSTACPEALAIGGSQLFVNYQCTGGGHDDISRFNATTGGLIGTTTGLANVGQDINASFNGLQIWANGGDACSSPAYNHVGCPATPGVPEGVINVLRASDGALLTSIGLSSAGLVSFTPDGQYAIIGGDALRFFSTTTFGLTDTINLAGNGDVVFNSQTGRAYAAITGTNQIAVFTASGVPEPGTLSLLIAGAIGMAFVGNRRTRNMIGFPANRRQA